ncbi:MAG: hypothetical protein LQ347_003354 [Umbilicaria vellea]|nr:MAG: hypothetical protein LQ347_003354 [Umbilicaria vellea]
MSLDDSPPSQQCLALIERTPQAGNNFPPSKGHSALTGRAEEIKQHYHRANQTLNQAQRRAPGNTTELSRQKKKEGKVKDVSCNR